MLKRMCPLVKKIIEIGKSSKGIVIPKSWLDLIESQHGRVEAVSMEINENLTIRPILKEGRGNKSFGNVNSSEKE